MSEERTKVTMELKVKNDQAVKGVEQVTGAVKESKTQLSSFGKSQQRVTRGLKRGFDGARKSVGRFGGALKALGIGLIIGAFVKLRELVEGNQRALDFFTTANNALQVVFGKFIDFVSRNFDRVMKPVQRFFSSEGTGGAIINFGKDLAAVVILQFQRALSLFKGVGSAFAKLFKGDFKGAISTAGDALSDFLVTSDETEQQAKKIRDQIDKNISSFKDYGKEIGNTASQITKFNKDLELTELRNRKIRADNLKAQEDQRQIRDDISLTIDERIKANNKLAELLQKDFEDRDANLKKLLDGAKLQLETDKENLEFQRIVLDLEAQRAELLEEINGLESEQKTNREALRLEQEELNKQTEESNTKANETIETETALQKERAVTLRDIGNAFGNLSAIVGETSEAGKAFAIANTTIATYESAQEAFKSLAGIKFVGPVLGGIAAAAALSSGFARIKAITATNPGGSPGSPVSPATPNLPTQTAPAFNVVGASPASQLAETIAQANEQPVKAFVVASDVSTGQALDRNIIENAQI